MGNGDEDEPDWEPAVLPRRGTQWIRDPDGSWRSLDPEGQEATVEPPEPTRGSRSPAQRPGIAVANIVVVLVTVLLAVAWWGALGVEVTFVYLTPSPMLDFLVLSVASIAWLAFVWRWLNRVR